MRTASHILRLEPYTPGEQPASRRVVKLNTNENPYPPSPKCAAVLSSFNLDDLRRYPDPNFTALAKAIADENGTTPDRVFVGDRKRGRREAAYAQRLPRKAKAREPRRIRPAERERP